MIKILTDTASDITPGQALAMDVLLVPLRVMFKDVAYEPAQDEDFDTFYTLLPTSKELPTTSQPSPADFLAHFSQAKEDGDEVIAITISGKLSGTVQSAEIAKELADYEDVYVIDSKNAALGQRLLVEYAVKLRAEGKTAAEINQLVQNAVRRVVLFAALDTLKYLRKGGRIPKSAEILGTVMGIKPIITLDENGAVVMAGKARGHAGAMASLIKMMDSNNKFSKEAPVYFGYTQQPIPCRNLRKLATARYKLEETRQFAVGPVIGTHVGPGGVAVAYMMQEERE